MQLPQTIEIKGIKVLTTKQIAEAYGTTKDKVIYNFNYNKDKYILGKHYIEVSGEELRRLKRTCEIQSSFKYAKALYLWTEKGALLHAKSLNTDKAWQVYDYLVDFYFRAKEQKLEKAEVVPTVIKEEPLKEKKPVKKACQDEISTFKILLKMAEQKGLIVKTKPLVAVKSYLHGEKLAIAPNMPLKEVNYELAFELFHAVVNYDQGNMINTPLRKHYNAQAERAANLIIQLLDIKTA
ncbi:MAG: ORF6N domain-containing protein [Lachnospiraceae bacterium]